MNDKPDYIGGGWLFYHDTSDKLNKEHLRILELPEEERYGQFLELKRNVCILREKNPYYRGFLSEIIEGIDIELTVLNVKGIALPDTTGSGTAELWNNKGYVTYNKKQLSERIGKDMRTTDDYLKDKNSFLWGKIVDCRESEKETLYLMARGSIKALKEHYGTGKHKKAF